MSWISKSENAFTLALLSEVVTFEACVELNVGVWHTEQPTDLNRELPDETEAALLAALLVTGIGGASSRMNSANSTMSEGTCAFCVA